MGDLTFQAQLQARGPAAAVVLDEAQVAAIGEGAQRFPVIATVNGYTWHTTVTRMGGEFLLGLSRAVRAAAAAEAGDTVEVTLELERVARTVELPDALAAALAADPQAREAFDALAASHRKEYARWVAEAKRDETAQRRLLRAVESLKAGKNRP